MTKPVRWKTLPDGARCIDRSPLKDTRMPDKAPTVTEEMVEMLHALVEDRYNRLGRRNRHDGTLNGQLIDEADAVEAVLEERKKLLKTGDWLTAEFMEAVAKCIKLKDDVARLREVKCMAKELCAALRKYHVEHKLLDVGVLLYCSKTEAALAATEPDKEVPHA